jgi:hypothetical protein
MISRVTQTLDSLAAFRLANPSISILAQDDIDVGSVGYCAGIGESLRVWSFRLQDLREFYATDDTRAIMVRSHMRTKEGRVALPELLAELIRPVPEELEAFYGPYRSRFQIIEELSCQM